MSTISQSVQGPESLYEILGVLRDADQGTIRKAYRKLALKYHPDRNPNAPDTAAAQFSKIVQANEILSDPERRSRYDAQVELAKLRKEEQANRIKVEKRRSEAQVYWNAKDTQSQGQNPQLREMMGSSSEEGPSRWMSHQPRVNRQSDGSSSSKYEGFKGFLNNHRICVICDTGADGNFVAQRIAASVGMRIDPLPEESRPSFTMAHGRRIFPVAKASAVWQFEAEPSQSFELQFFVLKDCIFDVMFGASLVYEMGLLSTNKHLVTNLTRPTGALHIRHVKTCGFPRQRLNGDIKRAVEAAGTNDCLALPDSGAQPNIVSYDYVAKRGWLLHVEPSPPHCRLLQFVDGSMEATEGRIWLYWRFGKDRVVLPRRRRKPQLCETLLVHTEHSTRMQPAKQQNQRTGKPRRPGPRRQNAYKPALRETFPIPHAEHIGPFAFDVLRGCPWDVIVGHVFLDSTDAFVSQAHCFTAIDNEPPLSLNPVVWAKGKEKKQNKKKSGRKNREAPPQIEPAPSVDTSLHDALEALALKHSQDRKLTRTSKLEAVTVSGMADSSATRSSRSSGSNIASSISHD